MADDESTGSAGPDQPVRAELRQVIQPVGDISRAVAFYSQLLGLPVRFVDGDRYAALEAGGAVLALAAGQESIADRSAPAFKVANLDRLLAAVSIDGTIVRGPEVGPHERRAVITDPWGNRLVVYASL